MSYLDILIINLAFITIMPILAKAPVAIAMKRLGGGNIAGYDNKLPRVQQQQLAGFGARSLAAHQNCFEALVMFTPAVLLVITLESANAHTALMVSLFSIFRTLYVIFYWLNTDKLRSLVWGLGLLINLYLLIYCLS